MYVNEEHYQTFLPIRPLKPYLIYEFEARKPSQFHSLWMRTKRNSPEARLLTFESAKQLVLPDLADHFLYREWSNSFVMLFRLYVFVLNVHRSDLNQQALRVLILKVLLHPFQMKNFEFEVVHQKPHVSTPVERVQQRVAVVGVSCGVLCYSIELKILTDDVHLVQLFALSNSEAEFVLVGIEISNSAFDLKDEQVEALLDGLAFKIQKAAARIEENNAFGCFPEHDINYPFVCYRRVCLVLFGLDLFPEIAIRLHQALRIMIQITLQFIIQLMASSLAQQITYYLKKAMEINVNIGGKTAYECISKNKDKFMMMKDNIQKGFHYIKEKIAEKEKKSVRAEHIRIDNQIQNKIADIQDELERMNNYLKKNAKAATEKNNRTYEILYSQVQNFKDILSGNVSSQRMPLNNNGDMTVNFSQMRQQLLQPPPPQKGKKKQKQSTRVKKAVEMTTMQKDKEKQWKQKDQQIDLMIDDVIGKVDQLKVKAVQMGQALDTTIKQIDNLDKQVDKVNDGLVSANKDLKNIVDKYKKPTRCCLDITLIIILIGLIVGIVKFAKS